MKKRDSHWLHVGTGQRHISGRFGFALALVVLLMPASMEVHAAKKAVRCPDGSKAPSLKECGGVQGTSMASSSAGIEPYLEYQKHIEASQNLSPLDGGMFGESVSLYNGSTEFVVTDIDIPGNNSLPVRLARRHVVELEPQGLAFQSDTRLRGIGNWEVDVPFMAATYDAANGWPAQRCSGGFTPPFMINGVFFRYEVWQGVSIHLPGQGDRSLLGLQSQGLRPSSGGPYYGRPPSATWSAASLA